MAKKTTTKADNKKSDATDRETELEKALQKITKAFGEGAVMKMGDRPELKIRSEERRVGKECRL